MGHSGLEGIIERIAPLRKVHTSDINFNLPAWTTLPTLFSLPIHRLAGKIGETGA
jgi:hypothetical protein